MAIQGSAHDSTGRVSTGRVSTGRGPAGMGAPGADQDDQDADIRQVRRLIRRSWWALAFLFGTFPLAFALGSILMSLLDVPEGELLSTAGALGWLAALLVLAVEVIPLVAGVTLALRARRLGAGPSANAPLTVHAVLLAGLLTTQLLQLILA
jgi:hypothetical protein